MSLWLLVSIVLAGCASERVKAEARKAKEHKDDYVDYYPVGSHIPIKVPKDSVLVTESETERAQDVFRIIQQQGVQLQRDPTPETSVTVPPQPSSR